MAPGAHRKRKTNNGLDSLVGRPWILPGPPAFPIPTSMLVALLGLLVGAAAASPQPPAARHNFHVSYGRMAVQGRSATLQVRFFKDDLEKTLAAAAGRPTFSLAPTEAVEAAFSRYLGAHFVVTAEGRAVAGRVVASGEENDMWWYRVQYDAPSDFRSLHLRNTLLFDTFDDQRNIVRLMFFPGEKVETLYFTGGSDAYTVRF